MSRDSLRAGFRRARSIVPGMDGLERQARRVGRGLRNLGRWAREDPSALKSDIGLAIELAEPPVEPLLREGARTAVVRERGGSPSGVICSFAVGSHVRLLSIAAPTFLQYGERHGWDVVLSTEATLPGGRPASWGKIPLIRDLLERYELVWWIDADALVVDGSVDIRDELEPDKDLYLVEHLFPHPQSFAASAGVMLWRSTAWSRSFLDELWADDKYREKYPWENASLLERLGYSVWPFYHDRPTSRMAKVKLLSNEWNCVSLHPAEHPRVNHHGGRSTVEQRRRWMLADYARQRRGERPVMIPDPPPPVVGAERTYLTDRRPSATMTRADLPFLLNERGLVGTGAEIGVFAGEYSARILTGWSGRLLLSIDPWRQASDYVDVTNVEQEDFDLLFATSRARLERFGDRSRILRMTSADAAKTIEDRSLDFVFVDARHDEASVREDLGLWYPKVRPGGIFAGHDYLDGDLPEGRFGVKSAVDDMARMRGLVVHVTPEKFPTWIVEVPAGT